LPQPGSESSSRGAETRGAKNLSVFGPLTWRTFSWTRIAGWLTTTLDAFCCETGPEYGEISYYLGEACIPKGYVLDHWTKHLFIDYIDGEQIRVFS
jgi:hypothetical protein